MNGQRVALGLAEEVDGLRFAPPYEHEEASKPSCPDPSPSAADRVGVEAEDSFGGSGSLDAPADGALLSTKRFTSASSVASSLEDVAAKEHSPQPLRFQEPLPPSLAGTECRSLELKWEAAKLLGHDDRPIPEFHYILEMQEVRLLLKQ